LPPSLKDGYTPNLTIAPAKAATGKQLSINLNEHAELVRLRKENEQLRMEREILKKAAVFFAKEVE